MRARPSLGHGRNLYFGEPLVEESLAARRRGGGAECEVGVAVYVLHLATLADPICHVVL